MLFANPKEEDRLCLVLKAYVEEWGAENLIVSVPAHWSDYPMSTLGRVLLKFETDNHVVISVQINDECVLRYAAQLTEEAIQATLSTNR